MGLDYPKQFFEHNGKPLFIFPLEIAEKSSLIDEIIIVTNENNIDLVEKQCNKYNIKKVKKILKSEQMKRTKAWMLKEIKSLIFHIKPKKLQGNIRFGLEDPCLTGEILAVAGVFYPLYGEYFTIEPFFEEQI
mgnify:CR=1 FL=1